LLTSPILERRQQLPAKENVMMWSARQHSQRPALRGEATMSGISHMIDLADSEHRPGWRD